MRKFKFTDKLGDLETSEVVDIPVSYGELNEDTIRDVYYDWLHLLVESKIEKIESE